jgi:hypothetical protein
MMAKSAFNLRALLALSATFVLVACVSSASASATVPQWYTGTTSTNGTLLTGNEPLTMAAVENSYEFEHGKPGRKGLHLVFQHFFTQEMVVEATGMECVSCSIENRPASAGALGKGTLKLTNAIISSIPDCQISSESGQAGTVTTKSLRWEPVTAGGKQYILFKPAVGNTVFQFKIGGPGCEGVGGSYNVSGVFSAEPTGPAPLNVSSQSHRFTFGQQADKAVGSGMSFGASSVWFEGTANNSLPSGKYWHAK